MKIFLKTCNKLTKIQINKNDKKNTKQQNLNINNILKSIYKTFLNF